MDERKVTKKRYTFIIFTKKASIIPALASSADSLVTSLARIFTCVSGKFSKSVKQGHCCNGEKINKQINKQTKNKYSQHPEVR